MRNAWSRISTSGFLIDSAQHHIHGPTRGTEAHRIAHHILHRVAAQQFGPVDWIAAERRRVTFGSVISSKPDTIAVVEEGEGRSRG